MSAIIKSFDPAGARSVRPLVPHGERPGGPAPSADPALAVLNARLEVALDTISGQAAAIERLEAERRQAFVDGEAAGLRKGEAAAEKREAERLSTLEAGIRTAVEAFSADIGAMEALAALVAGEAVARIIGASEDRAEVIARIVRHQVAHLESAAVIRVEISRSDFPDADAIAALRTAIARPELALDAVHECGPGDCRIVLQLGSLEIGIDRQVERLRAVLAECAQGAP